MVSLGRSCDLTEGNMYKILLSCIALLVPYVQCYCTSRTLTASTWVSTITQNSYGNNEDCTFTIVPSPQGHHLSRSNGAYFLEISWSTFNVRGNMPDCKASYVEVFLTRSYKSIGKFCSKNLIDYSLFTMYSYDGYAKLKFYSSDSGNNGFSAQYRLRSGTLTGFGACSSQYLYLDSDNFYTSGWPENYEKDGTCTFEISARGTKKLIFMDLDLRKAPIFGCSRYTSDYIEIRGAESSSVGYDRATMLKGPICGTSKIVTYTTSQNTVYVKLKRYGHSSNNRGIVAGYLTYNDGQGSSQAFVITAIISVTVGLILIISIASIIACCICKHYRRKQQERQHIFATAGETAGYGNVCHGEPQYHGYMGAPAYTNSVMPPPYTEAVSTPYQQAPTHVDSQLPPEVNPYCDQPERHPAPN